MWERRSYDDGVCSRCTVKFKGVIPQWPNVTALGVEWDDPSRGRNNGAIGSVQYFTCKVFGSGSFIKASRTPQSPQSFAEAVTSKYLVNREFEEIELSRRKKVETYDVAEIFKRHSQLEEVDSISLDSCLINKLLTNAFGALPLQKLARLDLSDNLLQDPNDLLLAISSFASLRFLRLNGNRFDMTTLSACKDTTLCNGVSELELVGTYAEREEYSVFLSYFPALTILSLANNGLLSIPERLPRGVVAIDLAGNPISSLSTLPRSVQRAYLAGTKVTSFEESDHIPSFIDLTNTAYLSWEYISFLGERKISDLQLGHAIDDEQTLKKRPFVIARCPYLMKLDGTLVSKEERLDAELYTIAMVSARKHPSLPPATWAFLLKTHGEPILAPKRSIRERLMTFHLDEDRTTYRVLKDAPVSRLHWIVSILKGYDPKSLQIIGVTDVKDTEFDPISGFTQVGDILVEGQRLRTAII